LSPSGGKDDNRVRAGRRRPEVIEMTLCPVALAVGCRKCPVFGVCPLKGVIGDYKAERKADPPRKGGQAPKTKAKR
jgi:hypothetical protein